MPQTALPSGGVQVAFGPVTFTKTKGHYGWAGATDPGKGGFGSDVNNPSQVLGSCASDPNCKVLTVRNDGYFMSRAGTGQYALPSDGGWHSDWVSYTKTGTSGSLPDTTHAALRAGQQGKYQGAVVRREDAATQGGRNVVLVGGGSGCSGYNYWGRDWKNNGFSWSVESKCIEGFDLGLCPNKIGTVADGEFIYNDGFVKIKCNYSDLDWSKFINAGIFNDNLGGQHLSSTAWSQAKLDYCSQRGNIDKSECKNYFSDSRTGTSWNTVKLGFCAGASTGSDSTCLTTINNVFKSTLSRDDVNKQVASTLVRDFCTANPTNDKCACWNATQNGYRCISDSSKSALPGCAALKRDFGSLPSAASVVSADTFCASNDCVGRALQDAVFMPAPRAPSQSCPSIQACIQSFNNANLSGAQIDASCAQTLNITPPPTATGTTTPSQPTAAGTTTPSQPTAAGTTTPSQPTAAGTTAPLQPTAAGTTTPPTPEAKGLLWPSSAVPGVDTKDKQIGLIIFLIMCCCCCLLLMGMAFSG